MPPAAARGNVLLCVTGSVAAVRSGAVYEALVSTPGVGAVAVAATPAAARFAAEPPLPSTAVVLDEEDDAAGWARLGDPVLHIALRDWADLVVVAPLSANTLGKVVNGMCDNLVTCVLRAWKVRECGVVVAPAMNTGMWEHPVTARQLAELKTGGFGKEVVVVSPVEKTLACGEMGVGAMASPDAIAKAVGEMLERTGRGNVESTVEVAAEKTAVAPAGAGAQNVEGIVAERVLASVEARAPRRDRR